MARVILITYILVGSISSIISGHNIDFGGCPAVETKKDFDIKRFEGLWYIIESFDTREQCVTWNISRGEAPGTWDLRESKKSGGLHFVGLSDTELTTGTLTPDTVDMAKMNINWPVNVLGSYDFIVHETDYDNIAGIFLCQQIAFMHRQNGIVLSRTPIPKIDLEQMARLQAKGVMVEHYTKVRQDNCDRHHDGIQSGAGSSDPGPLGGNKQSEEEENYEHGGDLGSFVMGQ